METYWVCLVKWGGAIHAPFTDFHTKRKNRKKIILIRNTKAKKHLIGCSSLLYLHSYNCCIYKFFYIVNCCQTPPLFSVNNVHCHLNFIAMQHNNKRTSIMQFNAMHLWRADGWCLLNYSVTVVTYFVYVRNIAIDRIIGTESNINIRNMPCYVWLATINLQLNPMGK